MFVECCDLIGEVADVTVRTGILEDGGEYARGVQVVRRANDDFDVERCSAGLDHCDVLGVTVFINEDGFGFRLGGPLGHGDGFGRCRGLIEQ